jgi:membrane-associated protein
MPDLVPDSALLAVGWLDPDHLVTAFGLVGFALIIFAECGLLVGFFLPGDTLLFAAGVLVKKGTLDQPLWVVILVAFVAAVAGNQVGYSIGKRAGPAVFRNHDSRWFRPEYVERTAGFFEKYGSLAIVLARFVPVVRTFVTVMAGASRMDYRTYTIYTVLGGLLWTTSVTVLGYLFGNVAIIADNIELLLLAAVALSVVPVLWHVLRTRRSPANPS